MFGVSPGELLVLGVVALLVVGPDKLPGMLRKLGGWVSKLRRLSVDVRNQSGIDDVLRAEGIAGGLDELRSLMRSGRSVSARVARSFAEAASPMASDGRERSSATGSAANPAAAHDRSREYPVEGADAAGALPEDLLGPDVVQPTGEPEPPGAPSSTANAAPEPPEDPTAAGASAAANDDAATTPRTAAKLGVEAASPGEAEAGARPSSSSEAS